MLKHLNGLLCLQFKRCKWVLDYDKIEWSCDIKSFVPLSNITLHFPLYVRCPYYLSINLQDNIYRSSHQRCSIEVDVHKNFTKFTRKHLCQKTSVFTSNKYLYFSQINVFIACHLSKIYHQSERKAWCLFGP